MRKSIRKNNKNTKRKSLKKYSGGSRRGASMEEITTAIATLLGIPALCILLIYLQYINNTTRGGGLLRGGGNPSIFIIKPDHSVKVHPEIAKNIPQKLLNGESINTSISHTELVKIMTPILINYTVFEE